MLNNENHGTLPQLTQKTVTRVADVHLMRLRKFKWKRFYLLKSKSISVKVTIQMKSTISWQIPFIF